MSAEDLIIESNSSDKDDDFDGYEFIVELVDDDEEELSDFGGVVEAEEKDSSTAAKDSSSDNEEGQREFFKYVDGFLTKTHQQKESRKQEEEHK